MKEVWQKQYPKDINSVCDFSIESLKTKEPPDLLMRYCPPYAAPTKAGGRPTENKRKKGFSEEKKKPKRSATKQCQVILQFKRRFNVLKKL